MYGSKDRERETTNKRGENAPWVLWKRGGLREKGDLTFDKKCSKHYILETLGIEATEQVELASKNIQLWLIFL